MSLFFISETITPDGRGGPDFALRDHGLISLLYPLTDYALAWVGEHLPADAQRFGGALVLERPCVQGVVLDISADGLSIHEAKRTLQ